MTQQHRFPWQRRVFVLDKPPAQGRYGWPSSDAEAGALLSQERATAVIVLRGERGMGKTYALRQEHQALLADGLHAAWLELKQCTTTRLAQTRLQAALAPPAEPGEWHVLLDGLDEGLNDLPQLDQLLDEAFEEVPEADRKRLRLRITCRSARWPGRFEEALRTRWQPKQIKIMGLAPLGRNDVAVAAQAVGVVDADALLGAIQQQGLIALATHPVTLLQLLDSYADHARLPATVHDAYLGACLRLCAEERRSTDLRQLQAQASPEHLLAVAARLAAAMQFGPYTAVTDAPVADPSATSADLRLSRLDDSDEPGHLGGRVPCTLWNLRQVTESSLLVPTGDLRWVFAHDSYREFLAAHFLRMRNLPPQPQSQLLWIGHGEARHIIPAHQEVAAWRATSDAALFADLLRDDPLVLLLADLPSLPDTDRKRTVDALFALLERDDTARLDHSLLHRLNHTGLADQLRPHLQEGGANLLRAALSIARACPCPELADDLLAVAEDARHDTDVRTAALAVVTEPPSDALTRIAGLTRDAPPEVMDAALRHLYPGHLTVTDYLDRIRDPDPVYVGAAFFFHREAVAQLDASTITEACRWVGCALKAGNAQGSSPCLALAVLTRAVTLNEATPALNLVPLIGDGLLDLAGHEDCLHSPALQTTLEELAQALDDCPHTRRLLARLLLQHGDDDPFYLLLSAIPGGSFLPSMDQLYWMEHWDQITALSEDRARQAVRFEPPEDPETTARADVARRAHPTLAAATDFWDTYRHDQHERAARAEGLKQQRRFGPAALDQALDEVRAARGLSVLGAWKQLLRCLQRTPDGSPSTRQPTSLLTLAAHAPSRPAAGTGPARRLDEAAVYLLTELPPLTALHFRPGTSNRSPTEELTAFALVDNPQALQADPAHWAGWAIALASHTTSQDDERHLQFTWLELSVRRAGKQLPPLLLDILDHASDQTVRDLTRALGGDPCLRLRPLLHSWALHRDRSLEQWWAVLDELDAANDPDAHSHLMRALDTDPSVHEPGSPPRQRWLYAACTLLRHETFPDHWPTLRRGLDDPTVFKEYGDLLAGLTTGPDSWSFDLLDEDALADLYTLLLENVGVERLQQPLRSRFIQEEDHFIDLLRHLPVSKEDRPLRAALTTGPDSWSFDHLDEDTLVNLYMLLLENVGLERLQRSGYIQEEDRLVDLLRHLPHSIASWENHQSAAALHRLAQAYPQVGQLRMLARDTARTAAERSVRSLEPEQLIRLVTDHQTRLVRDARQLLDLVRESLAALEEDLQGYNGTAVTLWNRNQHRFTSATQCWPCWEDDLSDAVASFLRRDIGGHRVVVNREVQVRRDGLPGLRTDIQIEAPAPADTGQHTLRVIIEAKGCWNPELPTTARTQLRAYLSEPDTAGLLLVGYFDCSRWNTKKRSCPATNHNIDDVRREQHGQVRQLAADGPLLAAAHVLDCRLPSEDSNWRRATDS